MESRFLEPNKKVLGEIGSSIVKYRRTITVKHTEAKTEQKYAGVGLSYGCLFLILSSYVYELNLAQVSFFQHMFIQYMMGTQNFLVFILFC